MKDEVRAILVDYGSPKQRAVAQRIVTLLKDSPELEEWPDCVGVLLFVTAESIRLLLYQSPPGTIEFNKATLGGVIEELLTKIKTYDQARDPLGAAFN